MAPAAADRREPAGGDTRFFGVVPAHTRGFGVSGVQPIDDYRAQLARHVAAAEEASLEGMVLYNFAHSLDPWAMAAEVLRASCGLEPIVSVQAHHEHPFAVARRAATLAYLFGRPLHVNVVAGASASERRALGQLDRDAAKRRLREFVTVLDRLRDGPVSLEGEFYRLDGAALDAALPAQRQTIFVPGSVDESGRSQVPSGADRCLVMAKPRGVLRRELGGLAAEGTKVVAIIGVLARDTSEAAWEEARAAFTGGRRERMSARVQMKDSASSQHRRNYALREAGDVQDEILWYGSARHGIDCPKLVGSYEEVTAVLERYREVGVADFVVDLPHRADEYSHVGRVVRMLRDELSSPSVGQGDVSADGRL